MIAEHFDEYCAEELQPCPRHLGFRVRWTPHPVIVTIADNRDYIRVLSYSYYTTITGWGVLLSYRFHGLGFRF